ncbi:MAG: hypothetical protein Q8P67_28830 [archaeon]|nr:hypothetical protein [archaeon]
MYGCNSYSPTSGRIYVFQSNENFDPQNPTFDGLDIMTPIELSELTALNLTKVDPFAPNCYFYPASNLSLPLDADLTRDTSSGADFASVLSEVAQRNVKETRGVSPSDMTLEDLLTAEFTRYIYVAFISEDPALISVKVTNIMDIILMQLTVSVAEPDFPSFLFSCFSGDSEVRVLDGESVVVKSLDQVQVGDLVESLDDQLIPTFSRVYYMIHEDQAALAKLLRIESEQSTLKISEGHLLYARSALDADWELVQARTLRVGDWILCANSGASRVKSIQQVLGTVRHPLTENHRIVVSGVAASVHVLSDSLYRKLTSPIRLADQIMPSLLHSALGKAVVNLAVVATDLL